MSGIIYKVTPGMSNDDKNHQADYLVDKNTHGVSKAVIRGMLDRWEHYDASNHDEFIKQINASKEF